MELVDFEGMSMEQMQLAQQQLLNAQMTLITRELEKVKDEQAKQRAQQDIFREDITRVEDLAKSSVRARSASSTYVSLREFGSMFETPISSHRVGRLLRASGIAIRGRSKTVPYNKHLGQGRACMTNIYDGRSTFIWSYRQCMHAIDTWLENNGEHTKFYAWVSSGNTQGFSDYVDKLHIRYGI